MTPANKTTLTKRTPRPTWKTVAQAFQDGQAVAQAAQRLIDAGPALRFDPVTGIIR